MMKTLMKRLLLLSACSVAAMVALAIEFSHELLSPRQLGIALLVLCIAIGTGAVVIVKKSAKEFALAPALPGTSIDAVTRKRLIWQIRAAKTMIVLMGVALVAGLAEVKNGPLLPLLVGVAMNLMITATSVRTVVRLKKILN
jgi:hypothetical protein